MRIWTLQYIKEKFSRKIEFISITKLCNSLFMFLQYLTIKFRRLFNALVMFHNNFDGIIEPIRLFTLDGHRNKKYV